MSVGFANTGSPRVVISGYTLPTVYNNLTVFKPTGWEFLNISQSPLNNFLLSDHFVTKEGLLFVSGGRPIGTEKFNPATNIVASYNFSDEKWTQLQSMKISRTFHRCQNTTITRQSK